MSWHRLFDRLSSRIVRRSREHRLSGQCKSDTLCFRFQ